MSPILGGASLGVLCFVVWYGLAQSGSREDAVWVAWAASTAIAGYVAGHRWPAHRLLGPSALMAVHPLCLLASVACTLGQHATFDGQGGLVGVWIGSILFLSWTPVVVALAHLGAQQRRATHRAARVDPIPTTTRDPRGSGRAGSAPDPRAR